MKSRIKYWLVAAYLGRLPLIVLAFLPRPTAAAGLWYVAPGGSDANACQAPGTPCKTINGALGKAGAGDTIEVAAGTYTATSGTEVVLITQSVNLLGGWNVYFTSQTGLSTVNGQGVRRGLTVSSTASALVERMDFQNGYSTHGGGINNAGTLELRRSRVLNSIGLQGGGGISNIGTLTITESTISGNHSNRSGGGIWTTQGPATIRRSTISNNHAHEDDTGGEGGGGGIYLESEVIIENSTISGNDLEPGFNGAAIFDRGTLTVTNSTIVYNFAGPWVGGIYVSDGSLNVANSLLYWNGYEDCFAGWGSIASGGYNLLEHPGQCGASASDVATHEPFLSSLQDNGGPTYTHALMLSSAALNAGNPGGCTGHLDELVTTDQRGYPRVDRCDIGAYELQSLERSEKLVSQRSAPPGVPLRYIIRLNNVSNTDIAGASASDVLPQGLNYVDGTLTANAGTALYSGGVISWTGTVSAGASVLIQFYANTSPNAPLGTVLNNTAVITGDNQVYHRLARVTIGPSKLYIPFIARALTGIQGWVTFNGEPEANAGLELRRFNGQSFSTQMTTSADARGFYNFDPVPSLGPGEYYYVRYQNVARLPGRLWTWGSNVIDSYTENTSIVIATFDIADVELLEPPPGSVVSLPTLFSWARRPATPTDSYQLIRFNPIGSAFAQSPPLGYVDNFTVGGLPDVFRANTWYGWYVAINSPDGGFGVSYYYQLVNFDNATPAWMEAVNDKPTLTVTEPWPEVARPFEARP